MASRPIEYPGPYTVESIRGAKRHFAALEWTSEKKEPQAIRVNPNDLAGPLPATIDGIPVTVTSRCRAGTVEMELLM